MKRVKLGKLLQVSIILLNILKFHSQMHSFFYSFFLVPQLMILEQNTIREQISNRFLEISESGQLSINWWTKSMVNKHSCLNGLQKFGEKNLDISL